LAFANTLLAGAKSSHGTTQPKMNPQPDLRSGTKVDAAEKGLDVRKKTFLGIREKCFFLTSPFIEPGFRPPRQPPDGYCNLNSLFAGRPADSAGLPAQLREGAKVSAHSWFLLQLSFAS
jgi:hypothetical protein